MPARNGARHQRTRRAPVAEEVGGAQRIVARLRGHILRAAGQCKCHNRKCQNEAKQWQAALHTGTSLTSRGWRFSKNSRVAFLSNCLSLASIQRKNRSRVARSKRSTLNTG